MPTFLNYLEPSETLKGLTKTLVRCSSPKIGKYANIIIVNWQYWMFEEVQEWKLCNHRLAKLQNRRLSYCHNIQ